MPKKDEKRLATDPFERFLPQIGDSRKKKDADASENESTSKNASNGTSVITSKMESETTDASTSKDTSTIISNGKSTNVSASKTNGTSNSASDGASEVNVKSTREIKSESPDESNSASNGASAVTSVSTSTITIERKSKGSTLVKMTHYFRPDQLIAIDELNEKSGRDKSELVRMAVDILIERAMVK